ncbi:MAG: lysoplasmalogenase family protein [Flavobacteriaceae bacterium]|nr:lysoplasmalogenase family protein [Flavobacteriaceae bacterium]
MLKSHLSPYVRALFVSATIIIITMRALGLEQIALIFIPLLTLSLLYDYHIKVGKDQAIYFILTFCLIGDVIVISDDFYYFVSALMAYWGASILFCITLNRELDKSLGESLRKWKYALPLVIYGIYFVILMTFIKPYLKELFIPIIIYSATLSFAAALSIIVYLQRRSRSVGYFTTGLVMLSITASLIGVNRFYLKSDLLHGIETLLYAPTLFFIFLYFKTKSNNEL